jgi:hypothetical protein
MGLCI